MSLLASSAIVSIGIAAFTLLPWLFPGIRKHSTPLLLTGTAVLFGVCFFDLIPEMVEIGGAISLLIMVAAWAVFSGIHYLQAHEHTHHTLGRAHKHGAHSHAGAYLLGSMALHCFSGGMLLVSSFDVSMHLANHVFWGLVAHKAFEAISVSSVLLEKIESKKQLYACTAIYALAFPAGVMVTLGLRSAFASSLSPEGIETIAMVITSVAVGSLLGCLMQDFLIPTLRRLYQSIAIKPV